jgi:hypothetical protein
MSHLRRQLLCILLVNFMFWLIFYNLHNHMVTLRWQQLPFLRLMQQNNFCDSFSVTFKFCSFLVCVSYIWDKSVKWLAKGWKVCILKCSGDKIFHTCRDWPWGPPHLLYYEYWVSFLGDKANGVWHLLMTPHLMPRLKKQYRYTSTPALSLLDVA